MGLRWQGGSRKAWEDLVGWSGSSLAVGLAEQDLRPERVGQSPMLLQSLGRTPTDPSFWTFEVLQWQRDILVPGKLLHTPGRVPSLLPCPASPWGTSFPGSSTTCLGTSPWATMGAGGTRLSILFLSSLHAAGSHGTVLCCPGRGSIMKELEGRHDYWGAGGQIPTHIPWLPSFSHKGVPYERAVARAQASWSLVLRWSSVSPVSSMFSSESACCTESSVRLTLGNVFCSGYTQGLYPGSCLRFHSGYFSPAL